MTMTAEETWIGSPTARADPAQTIRTLVRLRWIAVVAQVITVLVARWMWDANLPLGGLVAIIAATAASNLLLPRVRAGRIPASSIIGSTLVLDVLLLTGLLALSGGPSNPFSVLYLIQVTFAATVARARWTAAVVLLSSIGFGVIFFVHVPLLALEHHRSPVSSHGFAAHLQGMWIAFTLTATAIAVFVSKLSKALYRERAQRARSAHLLGLATLAAGAAHEIGNPLATIKVAAGELENELRASGQSGEVLDDVQLIASEVDRARRVVDRMAISAGELSGECPVSVHVRDILAKVVCGLGPSAERLQVDCDELCPSVRWPVEAVTQAIIQIVRNALQASGDDDRVWCRVKAAARAVVIEVEDRGTGMSAEVLERSSEPFFTTKPPGSGMGLGLFIARSLVEHVGGALKMRSSEGKGTTVQIIFPEGASA